MNASRIIYCLILSSLIGCTPPVIETELPEMKPAPVVAAQCLSDTIDGQSVIMITLSKSLSSHDGQMPSVDSNGNLLDNGNLIGGAIVVLNVNQVPYTCTEFEKGIYYALNTELIPGTRVTLDVHDSAGKKLLTSSDMIVRPIDFNESSIIKSGGTSYIHFTIHDAPETKDWYVVNYLVKQPKDSAALYTDPRYISKRLTEQKLDFDLFSDKDFINGTLSRNKVLSPPDADTIGIALSHISEGYFHFLEAQKKYGLLINQIRGEVINFPTNIIGGYGYFSMHQPRIRVLIAEEK
jgi:hypothetical protein